MKLYDYAPAPNPRRARMFLAEKGIEVPTEQVDLRAGEQFSEEFRKVNPWCTVPCLVLDDGTVIREAVAIARYFEEIQPEPPLLGTDPRSKALVAMWEQWALLDGLLAVAEVLRNSAPTMKDRALPGPVGFPQIPELVERGRARTRLFFERLNERLGESEYLAGPGFSMADITAFVTVEFAGWIKERPDEGQTHLKRWHEAVSARPSAKA